MTQSSFEPQKISPATSMSISLSGESFFDRSLVAPFTQSLSGINPTNSQSLTVQHGPLAAFEFQVVDRWLPSTAPEISGEVISLYNEMKAKGEVRVTSYQAQKLHDLYERGKILWCEREFQVEKLSSIALPMNPEYNLVEGDRGGPVIFIRDLFDSELVTVMNGNHRTMAHVIADNPTTQSLYVLEFHSAKSCGKLLNTSPDYAYLDPVLPANYNF